MTDIQARIVEALRTSATTRRTLLACVERFGSDRGAEVFEALMTQVFAEIRAEAGR